jgi:phytoene dehydrogenase-like protein
MDDKTVVIIGAGFAGLAAGIYAQMNGYQSQIYEMSELPGGLCTSWKRKGYTINGCIHWLVGSSPKSSMYRLWQEVGLVQGLCKEDRRLFEAKVAGGKNHQPQRTRSTQRYINKYLVFLRVLCVLCG